MIVIDLCSLFGSFKLQDSRFHMRALKLDFVTCSDHVNNRHTPFFFTRDTGHIFFGAKHFDCKMFHDCE